MPNPPAVTPGADVLAEWGNNVVDRVVPIFADEATRNSQIPSPEAGQVAYTADNDTLWLRRAGVWVALVVAEPAVTATMLSLTGTGAQEPGLEWVDSPGHTPVRWVIYRDRTGNRLMFHSNDFGPVLELGTQCVLHKDLLADAALFLRNITTTGTAANLFIASDGRVYESTSTSAAKTDIEPFTAGDVIDRLTPVAFTSTLEADEGRHFVGFVAEDVAAVFPEADAGNNYDLRAIVAALVSEVQQLRGRVAALEGAAV